MYSSVRIDMNVVDESDGYVALKVIADSNYYKKFFVTVYLTVFLSSRLQAKAGI